MTGSPVVVRRLGAGDLVAMRALNALFGEAFAEPDTYGGAPPPDDWLLGFLGREDAIVLVAEDGPAVVGGLVAYVLDKFERRRREGFIYDLAVAEPYRRQGIATALIRETGRIAREQGAWVMFIQADPIDAPAVALYDKLGVREEVFHFDIPVDAPPG